MALPVLPTSQEVISYISMGASQITPTTASADLATLANSFIQQKADDVESWLFAVCANYAWPLPNSVYVNFDPVNGLTDDEITQIGVRQGRRAGNAVGYLAAAQLMMLTANPSEIYLARMKMWETLGKDLLHNIMEEINYYKDVLGLAGAEIVTIKLPGSYCLGEFEQPVLFIGYPNGCENN